jgi:hypothetical protein
MGYGLRECGQYLRPGDDPTPRRAAQKISTDDPAEIELVQNHRARLATQQTQSETTLQQEEETNSLEFNGAVQNASLGPDANNPEPSSFNEEFMLGMVVDPAEIGGWPTQFSADEMEWTFFPPY